MLKEEGEIDGYGRGGSCRESVKCGKLGKWKEEVEEII